MLFSIRWTIVPAMAAGWLAAVGMVSAAVPHVQDGAGYFSAEAIRSVNDEIKEIKRHHGKDLVIETMRNPPRTWLVWPSLGRINGMDAAARGQYFAELARKRAYSNRIYVLICKEPTLEIQVAIGSHPDLQRSVTPALAEEMRQQLLTHFRDKDYDGGLRWIVHTVHDDLDENLGTAALVSFAWPQMCELILTILIAWLFVEIIRDFRRRGVRSVSDSADMAASGSGGILTGLFLTMAGSPRATPGASISGLVEQAVRKPAPESGLVEHDSALDNIGPVDDMTHEHHPGAAEADDPDREVSEGVHGQP